MFYCPRRSGCCLVVKWIDELISSETKSYGFTSGGVPDMLCILSAKESQNSCPEFTSLSGPTMNIFHVLVMYVAHRLYTCRHSKLSSIPLELPSLHCSGSNKNFMDNLSVIDFSFC